ncbi:MAG: glycoside hydrolase family 88 protein [Rikenellaceae bacterium]
MKINLTKLSSLLLLISIVVPMSTQAAPPTSKEVMEISKRVADWQIRTFDNQGQYRASFTFTDTTTTTNHHDLSWPLGALYSGMFELVKVTDSQEYANWLKEIGDKYDWNLHKRVYHADDHAVGFMYLGMYEKYGKKKMLKPTRKQFDAIMTSDRADEWHWTWCDALFMAPPVWAKLSEVTGDEKYLEYMHEQYMMTYDKLWSKDKQLFFRDLKYLTRHEANGESVFWSRGNGWVYGGLALMIPTFPEGWEQTQFYTELFKQLSESLKATQREDGSWSGGLLGSIEDYPVMETSGTAFFAYGLAWGINNGILDKESYEPTLMAAWQSLVSAVHEDGMLGYVQGIGEAPGRSSYEATETYGVGAFVAAGSEMYKYIQKFYE